MSRIGKKPVAIPSGVTAKLDGQTIAVKGAKGELKFTAPDEVDLKMEGNLISVAPRSETKRARAMWGMSRSQIQNLVLGVTIVSTPKGVMADHAARELHVGGEVLCKVF